MTGKMALARVGGGPPRAASTGEDRAKAIVNWTWAGFTHERPSRITVEREDDA